jgi:hypothetical protein
MKHTYTTYLFAFSCLLAAPAFPQTQIGGGTCNSSSLNGVYNGNLNGREVTPQGTVDKVLESVGTLTFDGQNAASLTVTANLNQAVAVPLTYSGTYSVQSNCTGAVNLVATGVQYSLNLVVYGGGRTLALSGQDGTYAYSGTASLAPSATCNLSTLSGSYVWNGNGYGLAAGTVAGIVEVAGALQFDGKGKFTGVGIVNTSGALSVNYTVTGTYTVTSACLGSATYFDSAGTTYQVVVSFTGANATTFDMAAASPTVMYSATARAAP